MMKLNLTNQPISARFRFLRYVPIFVCATALGQNAVRKDSFDRYGDPTAKAKMAGKAGVNDIWRAVNGQLYNINKDALWETIGGDILNVSNNRIVISTFTTEPIYGASSASEPKYDALGSRSGDRLVVRRVKVGEEKVPGKKFILRNYPAYLSPTVGQTVSFRAMRVGTSEYSGDTLELWDYGTQPTPEEIGQWRAEVAERQTAVETKLAEQRRAAAERAASATKAMQDKVLKWHLEQAGKGDSYGLFRMGEYYRDGDGVPKDLSKAREYFTKAVNAGSSAAADALSKLDQFSTNSPAGQ